MLFRLFGYKKEWFSQSGYLYINLYVYRCYATSIRTKGGERKQTDNGHMNFKSNEDEKKYKFH